jgi:opacity protein-like surface antigen
MALLYGKLPFNRNAIMLWICVCFAGTMLGALLMMSTSAAAQYGQPTNQNGQSTNQTGTNTTVDLKAAMNDLKKSENSMGTHDPGVDDPSEQPQSKRNRRDEALVRANFEKARHDAVELADLAKALQKEMSALNNNVLPLDVIAKADKIEKLAKKIKGNARGL